MTSVTSVYVVLLALFGTVQGQVTGNNTNGTATAPPGNGTTVLPNATTTTATTAPPTRPPWPKPNCGNPALNNGMRKVFLDMHNEFRGRVARGQTETSAGWGIAPPAALMYRMALSQWWSQLARFGMRSNMMFYQSEYNRGARNVLKWAKMAWWSNKRVGCSIKHCGSFYVVSCMYSPGGLNVNQYVYRVAAVCSDCPRGQCDGQALCRW
ncbi:hypothetical protein ANCCAN_13146 [Ancylostoma caninum]|uniref:SCP domain-containing protein n=1 Tax=Ancylostoma caninum TaxID=29170 RepID=A0A368G956_ANCCA|nr:hypothetical protein ANCCAN_13146 [Ancylostoma caninum]